MIKFIFFCFWTAITAPIRLVDHFAWWASGASESTTIEYMNWETRISCDDFYVSATNAGWVMSGIAIYAMIALAILSVKAKKIRQQEGHRLINTPLDEI